MARRSRTSSKKPRAAPFGGAARLARNDRVQAIPISPAQGPIDGNRPDRRVGDVPDGPDQAPEPAPAPSADAEPLAAAAIKALALLLDDHLRLDLDDRRDGEGLNGRDHNLGLHD